MAGEAPGVVTSEVVPAADAAPDIVSTADALTEAPEGGEQPEAAPEKTLTQSEVNKLIAKEKAKESRRVERAIRAEVERDLLRQQLEQRDRPAQGQQREPGEPQVKDYSDYEDFLVAKAMYRMRAESAQESQRSQQQTANQQRQQATVQLAQTLKERLEAIEGEVPEIHELVRGDVPFSEPMVHYIADSELGGKVAHYLATNAKEAARIAALGPAGQFRELAKLETKITAPPKPTQTPAPIVPNRGNSSGTKPLLETNQDEFEERRRAFIAKKNGSRK